MFFFIFIFALGVKTATIAKLRRRFCSFFFLVGQNRNFGKVRGLKLLLSLLFMINHFFRGLLLTAKMFFSEPITKGFWVLDLVVEEKNIGRVNVIRDPTELQFTCHEFSRKTLDFEQFLQPWHDFDSTRSLFKCFSSFLRESFKRRKIGKLKEVTLGLRVFD